jgi:hypothetical protein
VHAFSLPEPGAASRQAIGGNIRPRKYLEPDFYQEEPDP